MNQSISLNGLYFVSKAYICPHLVCVAITAPPWVFFYVCVRNVTSLLLAFQFIHKWHHCRALNQERSFYSAGVILSSIPEQSDPEIMFSFGLAELCSFTLKSFLSLHLIKVIFDMSSHASQLTSLCSRVTSTYTMISFFENIYQGFVKRIILDSVLV